MRAVILLLLCVFTAHAERVLIDQTGRRVTVPDHPLRFICLAPSVTDTVFALGAGSSVVAISDFTKHPAAALAKPSVGDLFHPSLEKIAALHPDLVIGQQGVKASEVNTAIERLGIPIYLLDPRGLPGILQAVSKAGEALNREAEARTLVASLQGRIATVKARVAGKERPSVFVPIWYDPVITVGKHAFITEILEAAGARSVTDDLAPDWPQVSLEAVVESRPQALVLQRGGKLTLENLRSRVGWNTLPAVIDGRIFYVDDRIELPSPVAIDALEELSHSIHP